MKAWILDKPGGNFRFEEMKTISPPPGGITVRMNAVPLLSYLGQFVRGELPGYKPATQPFTPGTNGIGTVEAIGDGVYHLLTGDRVAVNPFFVVNEIAANPEQALIGLTQISPNSAALMSDWPHGTLREQAVFPASCIVPLHKLDNYSASRLATLGKFIVPFGGLRKGDLKAGETLVVHGATGYFGSGAVLLGLAMGASKVVAAGRNETVLAELANLGTGRVVPVTMSGDIAKDTASLKYAAGNNGFDMAFDIVGHAESANGTMAALKSLRRGGRLILMGSMNVNMPIDYNEVMLNDWKIVGQFMYDRKAYPSLLDLVRAKLLDLDKVDVATFELSDLNQAMDNAASMRGMQCTVVKL